jgi:hypothetical protein
VGQAPVALRDAGDPQGEVGAAYLQGATARHLPRRQCSRGPSEAGRLVRLRHASDVPELERLARTIARWETRILRWYHTWLTNATNLIVKNIKRLGFGFRNFENYRLWPLLRCGAPWQHLPIASIRPRQPRISAESRYGPLGSRLSRDELIGMWAKRVLNRGRPPDRPCHALCVAEQSGVADEFRAARRSEKYVPGAPATYPLPN